MLKCQQSCITISANNSLQFINFIPLPQSCCLYKPTPFVGLHEPAVKLLNSTFGSSSIASLSSAYQNGPLGAQIHCTCPTKFVIYVRGNPVQKCVTSITFIGPILGPCLLATRPTACSRCRAHQKRFEGHQKGFEKLVAGMEGIFSYQALKKMYLQ